MKDINYPQLKIYEMKWKKIANENGSNEKLPSIQKSNQTHIILNINKMSQSYTGLYACYVYASTGTVRQLVEIKSMTNESTHSNFFNLAFKQSSNTSEINLSIENQDNSFATFSPQLYKRYYFECVTGKIFPIKKKSFD
jgi:hypothetical protein